MDAPTSPTTVTEERSLRIDYVLYQSSKLSLTGVARMPRLTAPIPDESNPSDHLPVRARLVLKTSWQQVEADARQWLGCLHGHTTIRPLSGDALRAAFSYFDKDGSGEVSLIQLEAGLQTLDVPGLDSAQVRDACAALDEGPTVAEAGGGGWTMSLERFVDVYAKGMLRYYSGSAMARQLSLAFDAFDLSGEGRVPHEDLFQLLNRMATAPLNQERLRALIDELDADGTGAPAPAAAPTVPSPPLRRSNRPPTRKRRAPPASALPARQCPAHPAGPPSAQASSRSTSSRSGWCTRTHRISPTRRAFLTRYTSSPPSVAPRVLVRPAPEAHWRHWRRDLRRC